jgi:hypothetical protein
MNPVIEQLEDFVKTVGYIGTKWLEDDLMRVYVRKGRHMCGKKMKLTLDIANVTVFEEGKGTFSRFIAKAHELNPWDATYVECVQNERLASWLFRNGWSVVEQGGIPESFYLLKKPEQEYELSGMI